MAVLGVSYWDERDQETNSIKVHTHSDRFDKIMTVWSKGDGHITTSVNVTFLDECEEGCDKDTERW